MGSLKPTKVAVGIGLLGTFGSFLFSSLLVLLPNYGWYNHDIVLLVVFADWALIAIVIPVISSMISYILVLKEYDKINIMIGFIFGGIVLLIGNFLVGSMIRYITSSTVIPEHYNLYLIITVGLVVVCGSALGILLGMFTGEPARETLDGRLDL
jgi:hypothetical protein